MNAFRLSLAASALAFGGALFAQTSAGSDSAAPTQPSASGAPAAPADVRCGPRQRGGPGAPGQGMGRQGKYGGFMRGIDADGDGKVTRDELDAAQKRQLALFEKADSDKDGVLSRDEMQAARTEMREEFHKRGSERRHDGERRAPRVPAAGAQG